VICLKTPKISLDSPFENVYFINRDNLLFVLNQETAEPITDVTIFNVEGTGNQIFSESP
jgi:hypothetical protein